MGQIRKYIGRIGDLKMLSNVENGQVSFAKGTFYDFAEREFKLEQFHLFLELI